MNECNKQKVLNNFINQDNNTKLESKPVDKTTY
jgi:hypothetical protein